MDATNCWSGTGATLHASPVPPNPTRSGRKYVALCGVTVTNVSRVPWQPGHRRCPICTAQVIRVATLMEMRGYDQVEFDADEMGR